MIIRKKEKTGKSYKKKKKGLRKENREETKTGIRGMRIAEQTGSKKGIAPKGSRRVPNLFRKKSKLINTSSLTVEGFTEKEFEERILKDLTHK